MVRAATLYSREVLFFVFDMPENVRQFSCFAFPLKLEGLIMVVETSFKFHFITSIVVLCNVAKICGSFIDNGAFAAFDFYKTASFVSAVASLSRNDSIVFLAFHPLYVVAEFGRPLR